MALAQRLVCCLLRHRPARSAGVVGGPSFSLEYRATSFSEAKPLTMRRSVKNHL